MAQHLRVVAALLEPQSLIPVPTTGSSQVSVTVIPRSQMALCRVTGWIDGQTDTYTHIHTHSPRQTNRQTDNLLKRNNSLQFNVSGKQEQHNPRCSTHANHDKLRLPQGLWNQSLPSALQSASFTVELASALLYSTWQLRLCASSPQSSSSFSPAGPIEPLLNSYWPDLSQVAGLSSYQSAKVGDMSNTYKEKTFYAFYVKEKT